jgi:hypothetical protein
LQPGLEVFDGVKDRDRQNEVPVHIGGARVPKVMLCIYFNVYL